MVEVPSGKLQLLYKSDISFMGRAGPVVSPNGRYIAGLEGSGFGDACLVNSHLIFIELASDLGSMRLIPQAEFSGLPSFEGGFIYPVEDGTWLSDNDYLVTMDGTCTVNRSQLGPYLLNPGNRPPPNPLWKAQTIPADWAGEMSTGRSQMWLRVRRSLGQS